MTQQQPISFTTRIKSLRLVSHIIDEYPKEVEIDEAKIVFNINFTMQIFEAEKTVIIINPISIYANADEKIRLGYIEPKGEFIIDNFDEVKQPDNSLPLQIIATYIGVVISAARGMLSIISKGTSFENANIPLFNPTTFLQQIAEEAAKHSKPQKLS